MSGGRDGCGGGSLMVFPWLSCGLFVGAHLTFLVSRLLGPGAKR